MSALMYTLIAVIVVGGVVWIGWRLFQFAHRKTGEDSEHSPTEAHQEDWPWSNPS
jgi:hypothetical protein